LYGKEFIDADDLKHMTSKINSEMESLKLKLENITDDMGQYHDDVIDVINYLSNFGKLYKKLTTEEKLNI